MPCNIDPANCMVHRIVHVARLSWSAGHRRSEAKTAPPWAEIRRPDLAPGQWHLPHHAEPALGEVYRCLEGREHGQAGAPLLPFANPVIPARLITSTRSGAAVRFWQLGN